VRYGRFQESEIAGHPGIKTSGAPRDVKRYLSLRFFDWLLRRPRHINELRVWHCESGNKLFAMRSDVTPQNSHIIEDVLDSVQCH
jgi:hypothetical protein